MAIWNENPFDQKSSGFGIGSGSGSTWGDTNPFMPPEESSNPIVNLAKGAYRGTLYGIPESLAKSWQFLQTEMGGGENEMAKGIADWAKAGMEEGREKGAFEQAGEMIPMSVGIPITSHAVGSAIMAIPHPVAKVVGGLIRLAGMYATPAVFGLSQAQETRDTARERGVDEGAAPYITGGIEWLGETLGNMALQRLLGPASNMLKVGKDVVAKMSATDALKGSVASFLKEYTLRTLPTEVITEMGQNFFEALTEREYGIRPEARPGEEALGAIAPTVIMTAVLGPFAKLGHNHAARKQAQILASPVDLESEYAEGQKENRMQVGQGIAEMIPADQPELRQQWMDYVKYKVENNQPIDISNHIDTLSLEIDKQMGDLQPESEATKPAQPVQPPAQTTQPEQQVTPPAEVQPPTEVTPPAEVQPPVEVQPPAETQPEGGITPPETTIEEPPPPGETPPPVIDETQPEETPPPTITEPGTPPPETPPPPTGEVPPEPPASYPGTRNWHMLKDMPYAEMTDAEMERLEDGIGPTDQETQDYNDWLKAREAAAGQATEKAVAGEERAREIGTRVLQKWAEQNPHISVKETAEHIRSIAQESVGIGKPMKASEYAYRLSNKLGIPNSYEFIGKILDKLNVPVIITDTGNAAGGGDRTDAAYYQTKRHIVIDARAMSMVRDHGPGYGVARAKEAFVHEALHAIVRNAPNWQQSEKRLRELLDSIIQHQDSAPERVKHYVQHVDKYAIDELISEAFTDSLFAQWLDSIPAEGVRNPSKTLWGKLKDIIFRTLETFGLRKSKLDELNEILDEVLPNAGEAQQEATTAESQPPTEPEKPPETTGEGGGGGEGGTEMPQHSKIGPLNKMDVAELAKVITDKMGTYFAESPSNKMDKNTVKGWIAQAYNITTAQLTQFEKAGHYDHKTVEEAVEGALVSTARRIVNSQSMSDAQKFDRMKELYNSQPNLAARTSESTIMQQYSTPAPIAYLMSKFLNLRGTATRVSVYEPTAGNGMLLMGANPYETYANELDKGARFTNLRTLLPGAKITNEDAMTDKARPGRAVDRIIANPPFGSAQEQEIDGYKMTKREHIIMARALKFMQKDGKAAFIIGGENFDRNDNLAIPLSDKIFYNWLYNNFNVTNNIDVSGDLYGRQGTKFPIRLITIEGVKKKLGKGIPAYINFYRANSFDTLKDILEGRGDNARVEAQGEVAAGEGKPGEQEPGKSADTTVSPPAATGEGGHGPGAGPIHEGPGVGSRPGENGAGEGPTGERAGEEGRPGEQVGRRDTGSEQHGADESVVENGKQEPATGGSAVDQAIKDLGDLFAPLRAPFESAEQETFYQDKFKPGMERIAQTVIDEVGADATNEDISPRIKSMLADKWEKAKTFVRRWLREEFENFKQMIKDAMIFQVPYKPKSAGTPGLTLVPKNQQYAIQQALDAIEAKHGNVDDWVMKELNYPNKEALYKAFAAEQIDALAMAIENISDKSGMILGDQTGVGKGRVVAGIIRWANQKGLTPVFVTEKPNLFSDMYRDLTAIDHKIKPFIMNNDPLANILNQETGEVIIDHGKQGKGNDAYSGGRINWLNITSDPRMYLDRNGFKVIFTTYSQHQDRTFKNQDAIVDAMSHNNIFILDESHNATGDASGGDSNTKLKFLNFLSHADGVMYSSATFAKTPHNMALYYRTALGNTGMRFFELVDAIIAGGNPLQEYISAALAKEGQYLRRELDFTGVDYMKTDTMRETAEDDPKYAILKRQYERDKEITDKSNTVVRQIMKFSDSLRTNENKTRVHAMLASLGYMIGGKGVNRMSAESYNFASVVHNFNSQLLMAVKVQRTVEAAEKALGEGKKVVINLMNTMGSFVEDMMKHGMARVGEQIDFTFKGVLERALRNCLKITVRDGRGRKVELRIPPELLQQYVPQAYDEYMRALQQVQRYDIKEIHASPIDYILARLGTPDKPVVEITNRDYVLDYSEALGTKENPTLRVRDKAAKDRQRSIRMFNTGKSDVIIINRAGSVGISLHASQDFSDQKPRQMLILQPNLDINVYMQALGRIFRKGQVTLPSYVYITSDLPSEIRPAVILERKMGSLKANTTAKQKGVESRKEIPDMMNQYGNHITREWLGRNKQVAIQLGFIHSQNDGIPSDITYAKTAGRITVLPVELQKDFYSEIENDYESYIQELTAKGENDLISKNYDYQAKSISKSLIYGGIDADNPFAGNVYREVLDVRQLRKPHTVAKIRELMAKALKGVAGEEHSRNLLEQAKTSVEAYWQQWIQKLDEKYPNEPGRMTRARDEKMEQLRHELETYRSLLNYMHIGDMYEIPLAEGSNENIKGILTNIIWKPTTDSNPVQLSKMKFVFSVQDPIQTVVYNASQSWFRDEAYRLQKGIPVNWDSTLPTGQREEKVVITGNMLRAFNILGQINTNAMGNNRVGFEMINFSRDNGAQEFGLLIARKDEDYIRGWDPGSLSREVAWREAHRYLSDDSVGVERIATSTNNEVTIQSTLVEKEDKKKEGSKNVLEFNVSVPASQQLGAKYYQDEGLRAFVRSNNFRKMGNRFVANIENASLLEGFMRELFNKFGMQWKLPTEPTPAQVTSRMPYLEDAGNGRSFVPTKAQLKIMLLDSVYSMNDNYKIALSMMSPARFFRLAATDTYLGERADSYGRFDATQMDAKHGTDWPVLYVNDKGEVTGHEGRARMMLMQRDGIQYVPVRLYAASGGHFSPKSPVPTTLIGEGKDWINVKIDSPIILDRNTTAEKVQEDLRKAAQEPQVLRAPFIEEIKKRTDEFFNKPQDAVTEAFIKNDLKPLLQSQNDFRMGDKYLGLPWWNAKKYPAWRRAFQIFGIERPEARGELMHTFARIAEPFFKLEETMRAEKKTAQQIADAKDRINRVLITGDAQLGSYLKALKRQLKALPEGPMKERIRSRIAQIERDNRYSDEQLHNGIRDDQGKQVKLNDKEIEVYKSVRRTLDTMFDSYIDHLQAMSFRTWRNQKWYAVLTQAAGMDLSKEETAKVLFSGLNRAAILKAVKIQPNIHNIFARIENEIDKVSPEELADAMKLYEKLSNTMQAEIKSFEKSLSTLTGVTDKKELTKMAREVFNAYLFTRPQLKKIKALRNTYRKQVAFFPRVREQGDFKMSMYEIIKNEEGMPIREKQHFMSMFTTEKEGEKLHAEIMKRYARNGSLPPDFYIKVEKATKTPEFAFQDVNDINMQKVLDNAIEGMKIRDTFYNAEGKPVNVQDYLREMGYQAIAKQFQSRGFGRHMTHRQAGAIKGYKETDLQRVLLNYMGGMAGIMTKQMAASDFLEHMKDVSKENNPKMFESLAKYGRDQLRNETAADKFSNKVRAYMFTWYLGGLLRPAVIQLTQNFVTGIPQHAKYLRSIGVKNTLQAEAEYTKAMKDVAMKKYTSIEERMQQQLFTEGVTVDQYIREIYGSVGTLSEQRFDRLLRFLAIPFSKMEMFNRQSAALTRFRPAYKLALEKVGKEIDGHKFTEEDAYKEAFESARDYVYDTHYAMGKANLPQVAQGEGVGVALKTLYTFKSFTHNYALQMHHDLSNNDFRTAMHSLAYIALLGGIAGLPFFKDLFEFIEKHFGYSFPKSIRQTLRGIGGKTLETFGMNGLPAVLGANISGSLAIGIPFVGEDSLATIGGVYEGQLQKLGRAAEALGRKDYYRVATNLAPEVARNPLVAAEESRVGKELFGTPGVASTTRGRPIYDTEGKPLSMGAGQAVLKTLGFNPTEYGREKEMDQSIKRQVSYINEKKTDAGERYRVAKMNKEPDALKNMMKDVRAINEAIKDRGLEKLVPKASVSKILEASRNVKTAAQRREIRYKANELL